MRDALVPKLPSSQRVELQERLQAAIDAENYELAAILRDRHNIDFRDEDDFSMISQADIITVFGQITGVLTIFLGAIGAISLLVGGIGILNIMLVSVTERTREIGLRKALGARRRTILQQFLIEAVVLTVIGGLIGVALAVGSLYAIVAVVPFIDTVIINPLVIVIAFGVSVATGIIFASFIILFLVPALIMIQEDVRQLGRSKTVAVQAAAST